MAVSFPVSIKTEKVQGGPDIVVYYPVVYHLKNKQAEHLMNRAIVNATQQLINTLFGDIPTTLISMLGTYEIKNNQRDVLSLSLANYGYHDHAAHGMTYIKSLTFDSKTGKQYQLADLFKPGSNYVGRLSRLIKEQIAKRDIFLLDDFKQIRPNQDFYIADKALVIYFQLYEITPYAFGFPMFPISVYDLMEVINEEGPLGKMAVNN